MATYDLQSLGGNAVIDTTISAVELIASNHYELVYNPIPESSKPTNCENCGAILHNGKCEYCGAEY